MGQDRLPIQNPAPLHASVALLLGALKQPGIIALQEGDTLRSVLLKAGGPAGKITPPLVWLLRGKPGEKLSQREGFDLAALLGGRTGNPVIRDRFEAGVRSATLHAHRDTPHDCIKTLFDACTAVGIPADNLKLDSAAVPD